MKKTILVFQYSFVLFFLLVPLIANLTVQPVFIWDESRNALNAWEMYKSGQIMVVSYEGEPDLWNTKPPFLIWMIALWYKLIGPSVLALRLPSVIATMVIWGALCFFSKKVTGSLFLGVVSSFVLITNHGFQFFHGARTGDYDATLTMFTTLGFLAFICFIIAESKKYQSECLLVFYSTMAFAVLTKSIAGLLFLPAIPILLTLFRKWEDLLKNRMTYVGAAIFISIVISFYGIREYCSPGYVKAVWENELWGRAGNVIEDHGGSWYVYIRDLYNYRFNYWLPFAIAGMAAGFYVKCKKTRIAVMSMTVLVVVHLGVLSASQTKMEWYDLPSYPLMSMLSAFTLVQLSGLLQSCIATIGNSSSWVNLKYLSNIRVPFIVLVLVNPYGAALNRVVPWEEPYYDTGRYIQELIDGKQKITNLRLVDHGYHPERRIYTYFAQDKGLDVYMQRVEELESGDHVLVANEEQKELISRHFEWTGSANYKSLQIIQLNAPL